MDSNPIIYFASVHPLLVLIYRMMKNNQNKSGAFLLRIKLLTWVQAYIC